MITRRKSEKLRKTKDEKRSRGRSIKQRRETVTDF